MESSPGEKASENQNGDKLETEAKLEEPVEQKIAEGSVVGQVVCIEGPMRNAVVSFGLIRASSDQKGNFVLEHVPPGIGRIKAKSPTNRFYDSTLNIMVETGKTLNVSIFLNQVTATLEGTVSDENGKLLAGAEVSGLFSPTKGVTLSKTDDSGHYVFVEVPWGDYHIRAKAQGYMTEGAKVSIVGGDTVLTNFKLQPGALSITGTVLGKEGTPVDSEIYLSRNGIVVTMAGTSSSGDGQYAFYDLVPDTYEINIASPGHQPKGWFGKLEKSETVNYELEEGPTIDSSAT